ncbi:hypothetical protein [Paraburkholderia tuberum]|uniref:hypothetical protein n=1 Tax=Paraburkholderia TaxID=1822464 RepID=UPI001EF906EB|nr:hypothetical protein [Paraburkholderia tuberum]
MKASRLALCIFNLLWFFFCSIASAQTPSLKLYGDVLDYKRLQQATGLPWDEFHIIQTQSFRATLGNGGNYFLVSGTTYEPDPNFSGHGYPGGRGYCEFDFFDQSYKRVDGIRVNIRDHSDTNVCNWIEGVSAVTYKGQPALLTTVQYHRGIDPAKSIDEIGNNYHRFTALLVLTPHPDGSLSIRQDDSCLGPGNQIGELATARKRITECSQ